MAKGARYIEVESTKSGIMRFEFPEKLEKQVVYRLDLKLVLPEDQKRKTLVMMEGGFHSSQSSFGVMAGIVAKHGAYIRFRSDFGSASADLECDDLGELTSGGTGKPFYKEGASAKSRFSIFCTNVIADPPAWHPKQKNIFLEGDTVKDGVFSLWKGQRPSKLEPPRLSVT